MNPTPMQVIIGDMFGVGRRVQLDCLTGAVTPVSVDSKASGNFHIEAGHVYALYAQGGVLYVQCDALRWPVGAPELTMGYGHDLEQQTTSFVLAGHRIVYPAWWANDPAFEPLIPERDEGEDYCAYLVSVWRQPGLQRSLCDAWSTPSGC